MRPWARVVIVAYNSGADLKSCVEALDQQLFKNFEVVIVDNHTPDKCVDMLGSLPFNFQILKSEKNLGFAGGCNLGAAGAKAEWIVTLNPDTRPEPDWLEKLKASVELHSDTAFWASKLIMADCPEILDGFGDVFSIFGMAWRGGYGQAETLAPDEDVCVFGPCAAAAAYKRTAFEAVGGFDEDFFCFLEDVDLALRLNLAGYKARVSHCARVLHIGGTSTIGDPEFRYYHTYKNYSLLLIKSLPWSLIIIILPLHFVVQLWITIRNRGDGMHAARRRGQREGLKRLGLAFRNRKVVRREKFSGTKLFFRITKSYLKFKGSQLYFWR